MSDSRIDTETVEFASACGEPLCKCCYDLANERQWRAAEKKAAKELIHTANGLLGENIRLAAERKQLAEDALEDIEFAIASQEKFGEKPSPLYLTVRNRARARLEALNGSEGESDA